MDGRKPGRPLRGDRRQFNTKQPRRLADAASSAAGAQGLSLTDYVGQVLAQELGLDYEQLVQELPAETESALPVSA